MREGERPEEGGGTLRLIRAARAGRKRAQSSSLHFHREGGPSWLLPAPNCAPAARAQTFPRDKLPPAPPHRPTKQCYPPALPRNRERQQAQRRAGAGSAVGAGGFNPALCPDRRYRPWPPVAASSATISAGKAASSGTPPAPSPLRQASLTRFPRRSPLGNVKASAPGRSKRAGPTLLNAQREGPEPL